MFLADKRLVGLAAAMSLLLAQLPLVRPAQAATFTVNSTADTVDASPGNGVCADGVGLCTLRAAIMEVNALGGGDTIRLPAGTFTLSIAGTGEDAAATGDLDITSNITIMGKGLSKTIVDGAQIDRVFDVQSDGSLQLSKLTVRSGRPDEDCGGGGIRNWEGGQLTIQKVVVTNNSTFGNVDSCLPDRAQGGGIFNVGTMTIENSTISNNTSVLGGGGVVNWDGATMTIKKTTFSGNISSTSSGGGFRNFGTATVMVSFFLNNTAQDSGGGFRNSDGTLTMSHIVIKDNTATSGWGGGFRSTEAPMTIEHCRVEGNHAGTDGGGFRAADNFSMTRCEIYNNTADSDGGGARISSDANAQVNKVEITDNEAGVDGGGINVDDTATLTLTHSKITGNTAGGTGGGINNDPGGSVTFVKSHVNNNSPNDCTGTASCPP